jgi:hypothetical protein
MHIFSLKGMTEWEVFGAKSVERVGACAASSGDEVFLFGGVDPEQGCWMNEMSVLDLNTKQISVVGPGLTGPSPRDKVFKTELKKLFSLVVDCLYLIWNVIESFDVCDICLRAVDF